MGVLLIQVGRAGIAAGAHFWSIAQEELQARQSQTAGLSPLDRARAREQVWGMDSLFMLQEVPGAHQHQLQSRALSVLMVDGSGSDAAQEDEFSLLSNWFEGYHWASRERMSGNPESSALSQALKSIQLQVEQDTGPSDLILLCSWTDPASAGLGSHVLEWLRRKYPFHCILAAVMLPDIASWEPGLHTSLHSVNVLLSAQWAQCYADGVLWFDSGSAPQDATVEARVVHQRAMEAAAGRALAALLLPLSDMDDLLRRWGGWRGRGRQHALGGSVAAALTSSVALSETTSDASGASSMSWATATGTATGTGTGLSAGVGTGVGEREWAPPLAKVSICRHLIRTVCPDPGAKFVQMQLADAPSNSVQWRAVAAQAAALREAQHQMGASNSIAPPKVMSRSTLALMRGSEATGGETPTEAEEAVRRMCSNTICHAPWNRNPVEVINACAHISDGAGAGHPPLPEGPFCCKSTLVATNTSAIAMFLRSVVLVFQQSLLDSALTPRERAAAEAAAIFCSKIISAYQSMSQ